MRDLRSVMSVLSLNGGPRDLNEAADQVGVLAPGLALDAAGDVDRVGIDGVDRLGDVVGRQSAGEYESPSWVRAGEQLPGRRLARAAVHARDLGIHQDGDGATVHAIDALDIGIHSLQISLVANAKGGEDAHRSDRRPLAVIAVDLPRADAKPPRAPLHLPPPFLTPPPHRPPPHPPPRA